MIDFAIFAEAVCRSLGLSAGAFEVAYFANRSTANDDALDADPVASAIIKIIDKQATFTGTATQILSELERQAQGVPRDRRWPKDATRLSNHLRRIAPLLRQAGVEIILDRRSSNAARKRVIEIRRVETK